MDTSLEGRALQSQFQPRHCYWQVRSWSAAAEATTRHRSSANRSSSVRRVGRGRAIPGLRELTRDLRDQKRESEKPNLHRPRRRWQRPGLSSGGASSCGGGLSVGPNTTCLFAQNVRGCLRGERALQHLHGHKPGDRAGLHDVLHQHLSARLPRREQRLGLLSLRVATWLVVPRPAAPVSCLRGLAVAVCVAIVASGCGDTDGAPAEVKLDGIAQEKKAARSGATHSADGARAETSGAGLHRCRPRPPRQRMPGVSGLVAGFGQHRRRARWGGGRSGRRTGLQDPRRPRGRSPRGPRGPRSRCRSPFEYSRTQDGPDNLSGSQRGQIERALTLSDNAAARRALRRLGPDPWRRGGRGVGRDRTFCARQGMAPLSCPPRDATGSLPTGRRSGRSRSRNVSWRIRWWVHRDDASRVCAGPHGPGRLRHLGARVGGRAGTLEGRLGSGPRRGAIWYARWASSRSAAGNSW